MGIENFFDNFEKDSQNKSVYSLGVYYNTKLVSSASPVSPEKYRVEGNYEFKGLSHVLNGHLLIDSSNNVLGRFNEQFMSSGYNLICGVLLHDRVPKLKLVKAPSSSRFGEIIFDTLYVLLEKADDKSSVEGAYKGACGLSKSSGSGKDRVILSLKKSMRVQV
jgi:hypothetical protein